MVEKVIRKMNITLLEGVKFQESSIGLIGLCRRSGDYGGITRRTNIFIKLTGESSTESWTLY